MAWEIDQDQAEVGDVGFLIETSNPIRGSEHHYFSDRPPYTNQSNEPRPTGWCGSYNDVSTYGCGVWRVVKVAKNGRVKIHQVTDKAELVAFLDGVGFPDLISDLISDV